MTPPNPTASGHTPGPWFLAEDLEPEGSCLSRAVMATDTFIAHVMFDDEDDEQAEANARLIAAAPNLLAAGTVLLEAAERHIFGDECKAERDALRAAIAKATGSHLKGHPHE